MTEEVWVDGFGNAVKTIVHVYDDAGREVSVSDGVTAYQYQYDLAGRATYTDNADSVDMPQVHFISYYDFDQELATRVKKLSRYNISHNIICFNHGAGCLK